MAPCGDTGHPRQVWAVEFQFGKTANGGRFKFLNVIVEDRSICLAIRVWKGCKAKNVEFVLEERSSTYPTRNYIRSYNGTELISRALRDWYEASYTNRTT